MPDWLKQATLVATGTAGAQAVSLLFVPILSRIYTPEDFGLLSVISSISIVIGTVSTLRLEQAVPIPAHHTEANKLAAFAIGATTLTCAAFLGIFLSTRQLARALFGSGEAGPIVCSSLLAFSFGITQVLTAWYGRHGNFRHTAENAFGRAVLTNVAQLGLGHLSPSGIALAIGRAIAELIATSRLVFFSTGKLLRLTSIKTGDNLRSVIRSYLSFIAFGTPQALIGALSRNVAPSLIATLYSVSFAGQFSMGYRLLFAPLLLFSQSLRQAFAPAIARQLSAGNSTVRSAAQATIVLAVACGVPALIISTAGPELFSYILGEEWNEAGRIASALAPWLYFGTINAPAYTLLVIHKRQAFLLLYDLTLLLARVGAIVTPALLGLTGFAAIVGLSAVGSIFNIGLILNGFRVAHAEHRPGHA